MHGDITYRKYMFKTALYNTEHAETVPFTGCI